MRSTLEDCFRELIRDKISDFLEEEFEKTHYKRIDEWVEDHYVFKEYIVEEIEESINYMLDTDVYCFNIINNDVRLFQEMFDYIGNHDPLFEYDGNVIFMFQVFTEYWVKDQIMGEDGIFVDMISEALEAEATERDRQKEVKEIVPLVINRLSIPNELTENIMLLVGEKC